MENKDKILEFYSIDESLSYAIRQHQAYLINWINFADSNSYQTKNNEFIKQDILIDGQIINREKILDDKSNYLILGPAGTGKTVLIKQIIQEILFSDSREKYGVPLLVRTRDIENGSLKNHLKQILSLERISDTDFFDVFIKIKFILFIDGLDEIRHDKTNEFEFELKFFYENLNQLKIISTSRNDIKLPNCQICKISPLSTEDILRFLKIRLPENEITNFIKQIENLKIPLNPLILNLVLQAYLRDGALPERRILIYRKAISFLLEDWDTYRGIKRQLRISSYSNEVKLDFLNHLAFSFCINKKVSATKDEILNYINIQSKLFRFSKSESPEILEMLVDDTGILVSVDLSHYQFIHKTFQEYLAAEYLVRFPNILIRTMLEEIPTVLAYTVLISSNPIYFYLLVLDTIISGEMSLEKYQSFFRTLFAEASENERILFLNAANEHAMQSEGLSTFIAGLNRD